MKTLLKFFFKNISFVTFLAPVFCFSQKPVFGIKAGLAFSNTTIKYASSDYYTSSKRSTRVGPLAGVYADFQSGRKVILRPGIEIVSKGFKMDDYPVLLTYVDFPVSILYKIDLTNGELLIGGGPSIGVQIKDYYGSYPLKTEFGINGLAGYQLPIGVSLNLNYSYGLSNASKDKDHIKRMSNHYLGISVGYSF